MYNVYVVWSALFRVWDPVITSEKTAHRTLADQLFRIQNADSQCPVRVTYTEGTSAARAQKTRGGSTYAGKNTVARN